MRGCVGGWGGGLCWWGLEGGWSVVEGVGRSRGVEI